MPDNNVTEFEKQSLISKTINIYTKPSIVFNEVKKSSSWWYPFTIAAVLTVISVLLTTDLQIQAQREFINNSEIIPEENKVEMLDALENQGIVNRKIAPALGGIFSIGVSYLVIAGALLFFGNFIYGGQVKFSRVFAMTCWGGMIYLPEIIVKLPLMLVNNTLKVYTSPALFMGSDASNSLLFDLLDAFDVFAIWRIVVFAIGFAVIYNFSIKKSYTAVISLYVIYTAVSIGLNQLFSGVMF
jgi:hypothetical protein